MQDTKLTFMVGKGTAYDIPYHVIYIPQLISSVSSEPVREWIHQTFGPPIEYKEKQRYYLNGGDLWLRDDADLTWFLARWS